MLRREVGVSVPPSVPFMRERWSVGGNVGAVGVGVADDEGEEDVLGFEALGGDVGVCSAGTADDAVASP